MPSAVIQTMRFDPVQKILEIVFRGARGAYRYFEVPAEEWQRFRNAPSKGAYLNQFFKSRKYSYEKIASAVDAPRGNSNILYWPETNEAPPSAQARKMPQKSELAVRSGQAQEAA
jgi:KTSC domain